MGKTVKRLANAPTMEEQGVIYDSNVLVNFIKHGPSILVWIFTKMISALLFNKVCTFDAGVVWVSISSAPKGWRGCILSSALVRHSDQDSSCG